MIYDLILYAGEADVLELRLHELGDTVDHVVITEAYQTHSGQPRDLTFADDYDRFRPWLSKIIYMPVDLPERAEPFDREHYQRNIAVAALGDLRDADLVIVSDVDEIPNAAKLKAAIPHAITHGPVMFRLALYYYCLDWLVPFDVYRFPVLAKWSDVRGLSLNVLRAASTRFQAVEEGGWHFSNLGSAESICRKMQGVAEADILGPKAKLDWIEECRRTGMDYLGRFRCVPEDVDDTYPVWVQEHVGELSHLLRRR